MTKKMNRKMNPFKKIVKHLENEIKWWKELPDFVPETSTESKLMVPQLRLLIILYKDIEKEYNKIKK